jgi:hypothetical protein
VPRSVAVLPQSSGAVLILAVFALLGCTANAEMPASGSAPTTGGAATASGGSTTTGGSGAVGSGGSRGGAGGSSFASRPIVAGPSYSGTVNNGAACTAPYRTTGFEPVDSPGTRHPLFLYFVGTMFVPGDASATYTSEAAMKVTEAMARQGFVALSAEYDNGAVAWLGDHVAQLACLFGSSNPANLLDGRPDMAATLERRFRRIAFESSTAKPIRPTVWSRL